MCIRDSSSTVFSKPLNWNDIINLRNEDKCSFQNYQTNELTEYLWKPRKENEVVFTCEELPSKENIHLRGSRYFHAIFEKDTGKFKHCDGSIIIYDKKKFDKRSKLSINNKVNDIGKEIKLFRVDGVIPKEQFMPLVTSYFYWNYDLLCYFCKNL